MKDKKIIKNKKELPNYTKGEEIFNAVTHIIGGTFAIIATILLLIFSIKNGDGVAIISSIIYGFSMIILFIMSSIYHFLKKNRAKKLFRIFDHCSIFLFIAGSYTPICLISLKDSAWGITLLCLIWSFAIIGITLNAISIHNKFIKVFSQICYLVMGWCAVIAIVPLLNVFELSGFLYLLAGGVMYTVGAIFYGLGRKRKYIHSVWHLFVLMGAIFHFILIFFFVIS